MWGNGDGQILAIDRDDRRGLRGLHRPRHDRRDVPPPPADRRRRAAGAAGLMRRPTCGWLVLLASRCAGTHRRSRSALDRAARAQRRLDRHARRSSLAFVCRGRRADRAAGHAPEHRQLVSSLWDYANDRRRRRAAVDPRRPAVGVHDPRRHRRLDADPPLLGLLHGRGPRLRALLRLPQLLRLLDAAAGPRGQLPAADRRLGVRRRRLLPADLVLVPAHDRHARRASRRS